VLAGHSDSGGTAETNLEVSRQRAEAILKYLAEKGVPKEKLRIEFYGDSRPIDSNDTPAGRAKNRRVEVHISLTK
jgi:outer membrane protein OmpA-like peptidoglycan-associated protein